MSNSKNNLLGIAYIYEKNRFRIARITLLSPFLEKKNSTLQDWFRMVDDQFLFDIMASISNYDISEFTKCHLIQVELIHTNNRRKSWNVFFVNRNFYFKEIFGDIKPNGEYNFKKIHLDQLNIVTKFVLKHLNKEEEYFNTFSDLLPKLYKKSDHFYEINTKPLYFNRKINSYPQLNQNKDKKPLSSLIGSIKFMNTIILIRNFVFSGESTISFQIKGRDARLLNEIRGSSDLISFSLYFPTNTEGTQQILEQKLMGDLLFLEKIKENEWEAVIRYKEN
ncbi:hypothetical protein [Candidatus Lokiarchaeum ossiferum]|uniref:hypothetical protein n=1 Tax=Candidatus Lokiarchaeum ossiferum TaxID=2951803 RepID=UPI00352D9EE9